MDFDFAHYMVTEGAKAKGKENPQVCSPSREAYRKLLAETFNMNRTRILAFKNKPPTPPVDFFSHDIITSSTLQQVKTIKPQRVIPQVCVCFLIIYDSCFIIINLVACTLVQTAKVRF